MINTTVRDVALKAGVSAGSVSNYFHSPEKLGASATERIAAAIEELGYVNNGAARMLRSGASTTIGHLTIEVGNPFFASVAEGVELASEAAGYSVFLANSAGNLAREQRYLELFEQQRVRGLVLSAVGDVEEYVTRLARRNIPSVVVDHATDPAICASVVVDDEVGGSLAAQHLADVGCRRIVFIGGPLDIGTVASRVKGARIAASAAGVEFSVIESSSRTIAEGRAIGTRLAQISHHERPDGVFAVNDLMAIGIMHGLLQHGIRVPDEVAVVGYDDIEFAADSILPLSTIRRPAQSFGEAAIELLLGQIRGEKSESNIVFQPTLVVRNSTKGGTRTQ